MINLTPQSTNKVTSFVLAIVTCLAIQVYSESAAEGAAKKGRPSNNQDTSSAQSNPVSVYYLQLAESTQKPYAEALVKRVASLGYEAFVETSNVGLESGYRVRTGPNKSLEEATEVLKSLRRQNVDATIVQVNELPVANKEAAAPASRITVDNSSIATPEGATTENTAALSPPKASVNTQNAVEREPIKGSPESTTKTADSISKAKDVEGLNPLQSESKQATSHQPEGLSFAFVRTLGSSLFVIGLILGLVMILKRVAPHRFVKAGKEKSVNVLESVALGDRRSVLLVGVGKERYLLGSTSQGISLLAAIAQHPTAANMQDGEDLLESGLTPIPPRRDNSNGNSRSHQTSIRLSEVTSKLKELSKSINI